MSKKYKFETTEEFIARGGKVTKLPEQIKVSKVETYHSTQKGPVTILSYAEANLYYGDNKEQTTAEIKKPKKAKNPIPKIDINALPESIRKRILAKFKENYVDNSEEEDSEDIEETEKDELDDDFT